MILNYLKLTFRLMVRNPLFTLINVTGLSVGFAVFFVLWQYSANELNSDRQWNDWEQIASLGFFWEYTDDGKVGDSRLFRNTGSVMPLRMANDFPEIEDYTRFIYQGGFSIEYTGHTNRLILHIENANGSKKYFNEENMICADANLFTFFSIPLTNGDPKTALLKTNAVVLSQTSAKNLFGEADAIGKTLFISNVPYEVTGVFKDLPGNTHLSFSMVISNRAKLSFWNVVHPYAPSRAYLKSKQPINWQAFENKINEPQTLEKYWGEILQHFPHSKSQHRIFPLKDLAFTQAGWTSGKSKTVLIAFQLIGIVVLILAVINYTMLTAARTSSRLKEVATRKVSGAVGRDFFTQFFVETITIFFIAILMALTIMQLFELPLERWLYISIYELSLESFVIFAIAITVSVICCTAYPVLASRSFQPRALISKSVRLTSGRRKLTLAMVQYTCAIVLLVWSFLMYKQISFVLHQNLGFDRKNKVVVDGPVLRTRNYQNEVISFVRKALTINDVEQATMSTASMGDYPDAVNVRRPGTKQPIGLDANGGVDENFIPFHGLTLVAGRNFLPDEAGNTIIISEGALPRLGFSDAATAIGARIDVLSNGEIADGDDWVSTEIIGVMKGYRVRPLFKYADELNKADRGMALTYRNKIVPSLTPERITFEVNMQNLDETMNMIQKDFEAFFPGNIFNWQLLDDNINSYYQHEKKWRNQMLVFTIIAIGVACLGLLGMISNKAIEKTKEIGVRKVLGARLHQIATLLLNTTVLQIMVATLVGLPAAYYFAEQYLQKFAEKIELQWWYFVLPVGVLVFIMLSVVAGTVWKAAVSNPMEALKHE